MPRLCFLCIYIYILLLLSKLYKPHKSPTIYYTNLRDKCCIAIWNSIVSCICTSDSRGLFAYLWDITNDECIPTIPIHHRSLLIYILNYIQNVNLRYGKRSIRFATGFSKHGGKKEQRIVGLGQTFDHPWKLEKLVFNRST